mgnify:CR=1 FL=1
MWIIEKRKQGMEIWVGSNKEAILVGEGYTQNEYKRSMELAKVIVKALNEYEQKSLDLSKHPEYESQQDQYYSSSTQRHP